MKLDLATIDAKLLTARPAKEGKNILSPIARMSFPNLFTARAGKNAKEGDKKKFGVTLLIPPQCDISLLKEAAKDAIIAEWGSKWQDMKLRSPFIKAETINYEGYEKGWTVIRASCLSKPRVVITENDAFTRLDEENPEVVYPGRWCTVSLNTFTFNINGNKGVSFGLNNVMVLYHEESLGGRMKPEDEFEGFDGATDASTGSASGTIDAFFS